MWKGEYELKRSFLTILITALLLAVAVLSTGGITVSADSIEDLKKQIKEHESEKLKITEEKEELDQNRIETEGKMEENLNRQRSVEAEIAEIENDLVQTQNNITTKENEIDETNKEIDQLTERIAVLKEEIEILEEKIEKRDELLKERLRAIQQNGGQLKYLQVIFDSKSFADFISRAAAVNTILDQDKQIMDEQAADKKLLSENKKEVEESKEKVVAKKEELEVQKQELVALKAKLDDQKAEREKLMAQLELEFNHLEEIKLTIEEEQAVLAAEEKAKAQAIALAQKKVEELEQLAREEERKRKEAEKNGQKVASAPNTSTGSVSTGGSGIFIHPAKGPITSPFGMRFHPIHKVNRMHNGIDFAVPTGTPLYAPADGAVSIASWLRGFGNVIMISHYIDGQHYTTVMAHLSRIDVSPGDVVTQGQVIGATGNTGDSTGPHLHFEVRLGGYGGTPVNPISYLP